MIQSIIKRDGRVVLYEQNKIASAILRALRTVKSPEEILALREAEKKTKAGLRDCAL